MSPNSTALAGQPDHGGTKIVRVSVKVRTPDHVDYWLVEDVICEALQAVEGFEVQEVKARRRIR